MADKCIGLIVRRRGIFAGGLLAVLLAVASPSEAARVDLDVFHVFTTGPAGDPAQLDIWVGVQNAGDFARFVFHNDSAVQSSVTHVYFDSAFRPLLRNAESK